MNKRYEQLGLGGIFIWFWNMKGQFGSLSKGKTATQRNKKLSGRMEHRTIWMILYRYRTLSQTLVTVYMMRLNVKYIDYIMAINIFITFVLYKP